MSDAAGDAGLPLPKRKAFRHIPQAPERILDAPELLDDYYLNLLSWGSSNVVAVALGQSVFLWNAGTGGIQQLMTTQVSLKRLANGGNREPLPRPSFTSLYVFFISPVFQYSSPCFSLLLSI